jgi:serine/threonine protein kinase
MPLTEGTRLGPYEILSRIGAGGMGEVYRARDGRLGRDVAVKILSPSVASDPARRARFIREARAASALADPHIVSIFDAGEENGVLYFASELVEGGDLRLRIPDGGLPVRKALEWAGQIASGLAAAHEKGIVHRDLKPENILLTNSGEAKIADFGLAKLTDSPEAGLSEMPTADRVETTAGVVMGTVSYMSPEQAAGRAVELRSDQFSLGAILYELLTGSTPFRRDTKGETLAAILRDEPPPLAQVRPGVPAPLAWIVERCLAKDPHDRYASTRDLARDLAELTHRISEVSRSGSVPAAGAAASRPARHRRFRLAAAGVGIAALGAAAGIVATASLRKSPTPSYRPLSFRKGLITGARFSPDDRTVYYSAAYGARPSKVFMTRLDTPESAPLDIPPAMVLSVSRKNELAVLLTAGRNLDNSTGTLARVPALGGTPRPLADHVLDADWAPDGENLAVCRDDYRIEYPIGHPLGYHGMFPRISPRGDRIAWIGEDGISIFDLGSKRRIRTVIPFAFGLAWRPDGKEVWVTGSEESGGSSSRALYALSLIGKRRLIARAPGAMTVLDVGPGGKSALIFTGSGWLSIHVKGRGADQDHEIQLFGRTELFGLSEDGATLLAHESREVARGTYLCAADGTDIVRLGYMRPLGLSPDAGSVLGVLPSDPSRLRLWPTGPGSPREIPLPGSFRPPQGAYAKWSSSGRGPFVQLGPAGGDARARIFLLDGDKWHPVTPEGVAGPFAVSPDGSRIAVHDHPGSVALYSTAGAPVQRLDGEAGIPIHWSSDGKAIYLRQQPSRFAPPIRIYRREISTGRVRLWREIGPPDLAGVLYVGLIQFSRDESVYAYECARTANELYLATGLD